MRMPFGFRPRAIDALRGYGWADFVRDAAAGVAVGVVALPLAMAFAIASGLKPEAGLFTVVVCGAMISALGGSRVQIGGPAGAFIVVVYGIVARYGVGGLAQATLMSGAMLFAMGALKMGSLVRFVPVAVVIGFTNGIAALIALSQVKDFLGLRIAKMPADFAGQVQALWAAGPGASLASAGLGGGCLLLLALWSAGLPRLGRRFRWAARLAKIPGAVAALVAGTLAAAWLGLPVETIGTRFGGIPAAWPSFRLPGFDLASVRELMAPAATLAALGAIESLLCAKVADGLAKDRHDPNQELMGQGLANAASPFFGGMPATGTIARTVANIGSGGRTPVAGLVHSATVLAAMLLAAPLASGIPLAALAAILMFVAWSMGEWREFMRLRCYRLPYRATLLAVFLLTIAVDLSAAVEAGLFAAGLTFIYRISSLSRGEEVELAGRPGMEGVAALRMYGALFFGAAKLVEELADRLPERCLALDLKNVIYVDSSGADALDGLAAACAEKGVGLVLCGLSNQPLDIARRCGLLAKIDPENIARDLSSGLARAQELAGREDRRGGDRRGLEG